MNNIADADNVWSFDTLRPDGVARERALGSAVWRIVGQPPRTKDTARSQGFFLYPYEPLVERRGKPNGNSADIPSVLLGDMHDQSRFKEGVRHVRHETCKGHGVMGQNQFPNDQLSALICFDRPRFSSFVVVPLMRKVDVASNF